MAKYCLHYHQIAPGFELFTLRILWRKWPHETSRCYPRTMDTFPGLFLQAWQLILVKILSDMCQFIRISRISLKWVVFGTKGLSVWLKVPVHYATLRARDQSKIPILSTRHLIGSGFLNDSLNGQVTGVCIRYSIRARGLKFYWRNDIPQTAVGMYKTLSKQQMTEHFLFVMSALFIIEVNWHPCSFHRHISSL